MSDLVPANDDRFARLLKSLLAVDRETEWIEFKLNNADPAQIGENISALSNSAALHGKARAYLIWGISDTDRSIQGTTFDPHSAKLGAQELENWLATMLEPRIGVAIRIGSVDGKRVVAFEIEAARRMPTRFKGREYIRVGSYTKPLSEHPDREGTLWSIFEQVPFENGIAIEDVEGQIVLDELLDFDAYFSLTKQPKPDSVASKLERLASDKLVVDLGNDHYHITNLGGVLFARDLKQFPTLGRKALRVIFYKGEDRTEATQESVGVRGYAAGFSKAVNFIVERLPQNEVIEQALRKVVRVFPEIAVRELVANALVHQDFDVSGSSPMVEIFQGRLEISNPGRPLIDTLRFLDEPPRSRNEALASLMRRMSICEERGSGIDKVVKAAEAHQLPAPDFRMTSQSTVAILFGPRRFAQMDQQERVRACYWHAALLYQSGNKRMTNKSLRARLGLPEGQYPMASKVIKDSISEGLIKPHGDASGSKRDASYVPFWV